MGRPSLYKEEYCQMLIDHMGQGLSFETFAAVIGVNRRTMQKWVHAHEDFKEAREMAENARMLFDEKVYQAALLGNKINGNKVNVSLLIFKFKCQYGWSEHKEEERKEPISVVIEKSGHLKAVGN